MRPAFPTCIAAALLGLFACTDTSPVEEIPDALSPANPCLERAGCRERGECVWTGDACEVGDAQLGASGLGVNSPKSFRALESGDVLHVQYGVAGGQVFSGMMRTTQLASDVEQVEAELILTLRDCVPSTSWACAVSMSRAPVQVTRDAADPTTAYVMNVVAVFSLQELYDDDTWTADLALTVRTPHGLEIARSLEVRPQMWDFDRQPASDDECVWFGVCEDRGACALLDGVCAPVTVEDCRCSSGCVERGRCALVDGVCVPGSSADCEKTYACGASGACAYVQGLCLATREVHCESSSDCLDEGLCSLGEGGRCRADAGDCAGSDRCRMWGQCTAGDGVCVAGSNADCAASIACMSWDQCRAEGGVCVE